METIFNISLIFIASAVLIFLAQVFENKFGFMMKSPKISEKTAETVTSGPVIVVAIVAIFAIMYLLSPVFGL